METDRLSGQGWRWLVFISDFVQKLLPHLKWPMAWVGSMLERWLNLPSCNGGYYQLLVNVLQGKIVKPDESSTTYRSVVGHIDTRIELDRGIEKGDRRYIASLSVMAAKLSYENEAFVQTVVSDHWKMEFLEFYNFSNAYEKQCSTQAIMFQDTDSDRIVVAFRGTQPFNADVWRTDIDISWYEHEGMGKSHAGFMKALGLQKNNDWPKEIQQGPDEPAFAYYTIREKLREILKKNQTAKFVVTGHSLGGALAILFVAVLALHEEEWLLKRLEGVYTFGQPRVGDENFGEFMKKKIEVYRVRYFRYVYCNDLVPRLPYDDNNQLYKHFGSCLYYNSCYRGKKLEEEPNKNYFSLWWVIPKFLNAIWELIRSFIIPYTEGPDYKEGGFCRFFRVIGLVIPGLSAHSLVDYVNLTRLGSIEPNKNYFSQWWVIPKILNAIWELIRRFIIPYTKGLDYKEGGFCRFFRGIGRGRSVQISN